MICSRAEWCHFLGMWKLKSAFSMRRVVNRCPFRGEIQTGSVMHQNTFWQIWRRGRRWSWIPLTSGYEIPYAHMWSHFFVCPLLYHLYSFCSWLDYYSNTCFILLWIIQENIGASSKEELGIVNKRLGLNMLSKINHVSNRPPLKFWMDSSLGGLQHSHKVSRRPRKEIWLVRIPLISLSTQYKQEPLYFHISNISHWHGLIAMHCTNAVPPAAYVSLHDRSLNASCTSHVICSVLFQYRAIISRPTSLSTV